MSIRERHTRAHERASQFSNKNGFHDQTETQTENLETKRILTIRKIFLLLLLLSAIGLGSGRLLYHPSGLAERILQGQSQCREKFEGGAQMACISIHELEKFSYLSPEDKHQATLKLNITASQGKNIVYNTGFQAIELDQENLSQVLDQYKNDLDALKDNEDLTSFYVSIAYHKFFSSQTPDGDLKGEIYDNFWGFTFPEPLVDRYPELKPLRISRFIRVTTYPDTLPTFPGDDFGFEIVYPEVQPEGDYLGMGPTGYTRANTWKLRSQAWELLSSAPKFVQELMLAEWATHPPHS